ncbi:MAG TPA: fdrA domain protein [Gammaproteobacteria bacterium]|nr:MAG: fdrA domain protein [Gammaproteobacteria bacterium]HAD36661.1 fdrA domain protein [Gammaproteobacteria bacterium]HBK75387.1 fdrA domain protein [Gammaproteobacteria bacterium]HIB06625.1 fdrA domain protein [Gammaproteobacteria bacterium]HIM98948.1 fdrA domain protein [Gammaproteobacteria bacterium]
MSSELLHSPPRVVNVGLAVFAADLDAQDVDVVHVDWRPPAGGDKDLARLLSMLTD